MDPAEVLEILRVTGAGREGHFLLTSGRRSSHFFLCAPLTQNPERTSLIAAALAEPYLEAGIETVAGPAMGGVVLGYEVARQIGPRGSSRPGAIYTEKTDSGAMALRRGWSLHAGERTLIVEDAVSTGGSVQKAIDAIRPSGSDPRPVSVIADRSGGSARFEVPLHAFVTIHPRMWEAKACPLCQEGVPLVRPKT